MKEEEEYWTGGGAEMKVSRQGIVTAIMPKPLPGRDRLLSFPSVIIIII